MQRHPNSRHQAGRPRGAVHTSVAERARARGIRLALGIGMGLCSAIVAADPLPMLFGPPAAPAAAVAKGQVLERGIGRERRVAVDFRALDAQSRVGSEVGVELFDGEIVTVQLDQLEQRGPSNFTWHAHVKGNDESNVVFTVVDGHLEASLIVPDTGKRGGRSFRVHSGPDGTQSVQQVNQEGFPSDHPPGEERSHIAPLTKAQTSADAASTQDAKAAVSQADTGLFVDVMVVYSNQTATAAGSAIGAQIQQAIDSANTAYANSGVSMRLRLAHYEQVNYDESGDFNTDLNRLTTANDGYMDNVPALRNTYGADLVSLFVENMQYCGLAWVGPNASYAFSVVNRTCASSNLSFAHELAHNFGALHDPYVDASTSPYAYGHGLIDPAGAWRTVMAYNDGCAAAGVNCTRIPYFSNPSLRYGASGDPMGTTSVSDNARVLNQNAQTVANFRASVIDGGCSYALSPASASVGAAAASASITVSAGAGCTWNATSNASWLAIAAGSGTAGSGTLSYTAAANSGPARTGTITVGGQLLTVSQAGGCTYAMNPNSASVAATGGKGTVSLTAGAGCAWTASSSASWLTVSAASGTAAATLSYSVAANAGAQRTANLSVNGATFIVTQSAAAIAPPTGTALASISAGSLSFGATRVGKPSAVKTVTVTNRGTATLGISAITSGGTNPGDFVRSGTCAVGSSLAAGKSCTIGYSFKPTATGTRTAAITITTNGGNPKLQLSGTGK